MSEMNSAETAQEAVIEAVESQKVSEDQPDWHRQVAVTTLILAVVAAIGGMLAGISAHEALVDRTEQIIELNYLEGNQIFVTTLRSKHEILTSMGETPDPSEVEMVEEIEERNLELKEIIAHEGEEAHEAGNAHVIFAVAVTLISLGITLGGMAVIVERKWLWVSGIVIGALGIIGVGLGLAEML